MLLALLTLLTIGPLVVRAAAPGVPAGGEMLKVGGDGWGPLASPDSYRTIPLGSANVSGGERDDLFVAAPVGRTTGVWLYRYSATGSDGAPRFDSPLKVAIPWERPPSFSGWMRQLDGKIHAGWFVPEQRIKVLGFSSTLLPRQLAFCTFDPKKNAFALDRSVVLPKDFPKRIVAVTPGEVAGGVWEFFLLGGNAPAPAPPKTSDGRASLYDGAGIYRGKLPRNGVYRFTVNPVSGEWEMPHLITPTDRDILGGSGLTRWGNAVIVANQFGAFYLLPARPKTPVAPVQLRAGGKVMFHPTFGPVPVCYPGTTAHPAALLAGGEGALYAYAATGAADGTRFPVFAEPQTVLERDAALFGGALAVPNLVDWDGDGAPDLICGNSEGRVLFFKNRGCVEAPDFAPGVELAAGGAAIHIQPGYYGVQGPFEARWGYACPTVADWNSDGLPDLLMSDATGKHRVFLNVGTRADPVLAPEKILKCEGLELHGSWRVKPDAALLDGRMAYVAYDDENTLHLYWRLDDEFVADGGKLRWRDGREMKIYYLEHTAPGQSGRGKITLFDWDGDGKIDILFGAMRRNSLPGPERGLPWTRFHEDKAAAMSILFLRNIGENSAPVFDFPKQFQLRGRDFYFGAHVSGPTAGALGPKPGPNLVVGNESGRLFFFRRADLTYADFKFDE